MGKLYTLSDKTKQCRTNFVTFVQ